MEIIWMIILVGVLIFFVGAGTFFNFVFLSESEMVAAWIATLLFALIMCIVISYICLNEKWSIKVALGLIAGFGLIQLIILCNIETPSFWEEDGGFVRIFAAWGFQSVVCLVGYGISKVVVANFDDATSTMINELQSLIRKKLNVLMEVDNEIVKTGELYKTTDKLISLLGLIADNKLSEAYRDAQLQNNSFLIEYIEENVRKNKLHIDIKDKTLSEIKELIEKEIIEKQTLLQDISQKQYSRKDYSFLKQKIKYEKL